MRRLVLTLAVLLLVGCASDRDTTTDLDVVANADFSFTPRVATVPSGEPVTLTFTARGETHTYVVKDAIQDGPIDVSDGLLTRRATGPNDVILAEADQDETVVVTFTVQERGVYLLYCMLEGHREDGMFGTLIVE